MPKLIRHQVVLPLRPIRIIVRRVAIDEPVQEDGVRGNAPIVGGGEVGMVFPLPPVVQRALGGFVLVQVEQDLLRVIAKGEHAVNEQTC